DSGQARTNTEAAVKRCRLCSAKASREHGFIGNDRALARSQLELPQKEDLVSLSELMYNCIAWPIAAVQSMDDASRILRDLFVRALADAFAVMSEVQESFFRAYFDDSFFLAFHKYTSALLLYLREVQGPGGDIRSRQLCRVLDDLYLATGKHYPHANLKTSTSSSSIGVGGAGKSAPAGAGPAGGDETLLHLNDRAPQHHLQVDDCLAALGDGTPRGPRENDAPRGPRKNCSQDD
ncbi:unnamed protein product, partial [Amoebophrya sp. A25]